MAVSHAAGVPAQLVAWSMRSCYGVGTAVTLHFHGLVSQNAFGYSKQWTLWILEMPYTGQALSAATPGMHDYGLTNGLSGDDTGGNNIVATQVFGLEDFVFETRTDHLYLVGVPTVTHVPWYSNGGVLEFHTTPSPGPIRSDPTCTAVNSTVYAMTGPGTYPPSLYGMQTDTSGNKFTTSTDTSGVWNSGGGLTEFPLAGQESGHSNGGACNGWYTAGGVDYYTGGLNTYIRIWTIGPGTATIHTRSHTKAGGNCGIDNTPMTAQAYLSGVGITPVGASVTRPAGTDIPLVIPDDGYCAHYIHVGGSTGPWGFAGFTWQPLNPDLFGCPPPPVPVLEPPEQQVSEFPVIRGTSWVGAGSTSTVTTDDGDDSDHDASQIAVMDAGDYFEGASVEAALQELASAPGVGAHIADTDDAHDGSSVSFVPAAGIAATDVQAAVDELVADLATHLAGPMSHEALDIPFTPTGSISATTVQDAIAEALGEGSAGPSTGGLVPVITTSPNIVTTTGEPVWLPLVHPDGTPILLETG